MKKKYPKINKCRATFIPESIEQQINRTAGTLKQDLLIHSINL